MGLTAAPRAAKLRRRRAPIVGLAVVLLFAGLWGGLQRLGVFPPTTLSASDAEHGILMTLGFLGTVISLERAVALDRAWAYAAPVATMIGVAIAFLDSATSLGPALVTFGGFVLLAAHVNIHRRQPSAHNLVMGVGAVSWCAAGVYWLDGADISLFYPLLAGFLVLTIVGERLELTRAANRSKRAGRLLLFAVAVFVAGLAVSIWSEPLGIRIAGAGLAGQGLWLAFYDITRRTIKIPGITRYMASALLAGYGWLLCAGVLWIIDGAVNDGPAYDASLHAVFLGFVMSMIFAHAPVIVPAVLRVQLPYHRGFYVQLVLLHVGLLVRLLGGDLLGGYALWQWGGITNEVAILLFLAATAMSVGGASRRARQARKAPEQRKPRLAPVPTSRRDPLAHS